MKNPSRITNIVSFSLSIVISLFVHEAEAYGNDGLLYDSSAYTECKTYPEKPLYRGGILINNKIINNASPPPPAQPNGIVVNGSIENAAGRGDGGGVNYSPAFVLNNLTQSTKYCFSSWVKIKGADSALIRVSLSTQHSTYRCIASVIARTRCWSFLKGGFVLNSSSNTSLLTFQNTDDTVIDISIASSSLQPFTDEEWSINQEYRINNDRKRAVTLHVSDPHGNRVEGAQISIQQISKDFPFGSAIAKTIIGNLPYQDWFVKRFNAAVFENELKWYATEPKQGQVNYSVADQMLEFIRANQIIVRGHNIFWEDPIYIPSWVRNLTTGEELQAAVNSRIQSLLNKYKNDFIHWDISNERLHFSFYEDKLGTNATLEFFKTAHEYDPLATLFMNDFNVVETCVDVNSTVDSYINRLKELKKGGATMDGIGLEGHFTVPNLPLMRAVLDKLATLGLPIWLTEIDISKTLDKQTQAIYLEQVLREGFSHPSVDGIMLWTALHPNGCYQMCLTDEDLNNLPAGDVVDKLLQEWQTVVRTGQTDEHGSHSFFGFLGEYSVNVRHGNKSINSTFSLPRSPETKHFSIQL